jgi:hypothetical protein
MCKLNPIQLFKRGAILASKAIFLSFIIVIILGLMTNNLAYSYELEFVWGEVEHDYIAGYRLYYGTASKDYTWKMDVGAKASATITNLQPGTIYYFAVTAYDYENNDGEFSEEVSYPNLNINNAIIVSLSAYPEALNSYVYFRTHALDNTYNWCTTSDEKIIDTGVQAMIDSRKVNIVVGNNCNTKITSSCGACNVIRLNP